jgi:hypothetical protein
MVLELIKVDEGQKIGRDRVKKGRGRKSGFCWLVDDVTKRQPPQDHPPVYAGFINFNSYIASTNQQLTTYYILFISVRVLVLS